MDINLGEWVGKMNVYLKGMYFSMLLMAVSLFNNGLFADYILLSIVYFWLGYILNFKFCEKSNKSGHGIAEIILFIVYLLCMGALIFVHTKGIL